MSYLCGMERMGYTIRQKGDGWWITKRLSKPRGYKRHQGIHGPFPNKELAERELMTIEDYQN